MKYIIPSIATLIIGFVIGAKITINKSKPIYESSSNKRVIDFKRRDFSKRSTDSVWWSYGDEVTVIIDSSNKNLKVTEDRYLNHDTIGFKNYTPAVLINGTGTSYKAWGDTIRIYPCGSQKTVTNINHVEVLNQGQGL